MASAPEQPRPDRLAALRGRLRTLFHHCSAPAAPPIETLSRRELEGYVEELVAYRNGEGELVKAFALRPAGPGPFPGMVVHHQHNSEWHLGKSEVAGRAGVPLQALGPSLARRGVAVLAPDTICFEDRRRNIGGILPRDDDRAQHYNEMSYRLVQGSLLMSRVVADAALAVSVLGGMTHVDSASIGAMGHSMGGHTVLFSAPLDDRVRFACVSGAASGYRARIADGTGIEVAQVIPAILSITDSDGLLELIAPRPLLVVSADEDPYSRAAPAIVEGASRTYKALGADSLLEHARYRGGHALTPERVSRMIDWAVTTCQALRSRSRCHALSTCSAIRSAE